MIIEAFKILHERFDLRIHPRLSLVVLVFSLASACDTYIQEHYEAQCGYVSYHTIER